MKVTKTGDYCKLVATTQYQPGDVIRVLVGETSNKPTRTSIQISPTEHVEDEYGQYTNHSFLPSTRIFNGCIVAIRNIDIGEEITFNYNESETKLACPFADIDTGILVHGNQTK